jgi:dsRNA-specific ribonuclease
MIAIRYGMHELILMDYPENDKVMKEFQLILNNYNHFLNNPEALIEAKVSSIKILGDVFESLVGAIFVDLDFDYVATKAVVMKIIKDFLIHYTDLETLKKTSTFKYQ